MIGTTTLFRRYLYIVCVRLLILKYVQTFANGQIVAHPRGKQLGGSSAINWLFWTHASRKDIDNWGTLGNANWTWDALVPYYQRSEEYVAPSSATENALETQYIDSTLHGAQGPIIDSFPSVYGPLDEAWPRTYASLGLSPSSDPRDGLALGGYTNLININPADWSRSYAATGYLARAENRSNLMVVTGAQANQILFKQDVGGPTANGVSYMKDGVLKEISVKQEIILCAGSFGSPQLLELSGVGNADILSNLGIQTLVNNINVGENLQGVLEAVSNLHIWLITTDHAYVPIGSVLSTTRGIFTYFAPQI